MSYVSTKTFGHEVGLSACFRQWRAKSHCRLLHGYALAVRVEFEARHLDERNWVVDFGNCGRLKARLQATFDHALLVAQDDPQLKDLMDLHDQGLARVVLLPATGCEAFARTVYGMAEDFLADIGAAPRVRVRSVEVREHGANSATYSKAA